MLLSTWLTFFVAAGAISFSPGAGAISAMSCGLHHGFWRTYWTTLGLITGIIFQFILVGLGLGALLATSELAFAIVKYLGVAYLIYLGVKQFRTDAIPLAGGNVASANVPARELVLRGFLINASNPKCTVFLLAVVPQFVNLAQPLIPQHALMALTLGVTDLVAMSCYALLASRFLRLLKSPHQVCWMNRGFGLLFILTGVLLAGFRPTY